MTMTDAQRELLGMYRATPDILRGLTRGLTDDDARTGGEGSDSWSPVEIVCHLRDAEERSMARTRMMRDEDRPALIGYDENELAEQGRYREQSLTAVVEELIRLREEHIRELEALTEDQWSREGEHNQMGTLSIQSITHHMAFHDAVHLAQLGRT